ncbi:PIG-L deacetylase family protein [Embleya sp. NPDC050154]|uniref:PIG-L deacetylase family protein n=1 Tax=Embleya sp. NPDC050154 TaxID=3363988 RepID=UPI0037A87739
MTGERAPADPIQAPGTPERVWRAWRALTDLPRVAPSEMAGPFRAGGLVVVAAHPDDEILGAGGLIAAHLDTGSRVRVVLLTDGEKSHPGGPIPPPLLRARRIRETERALGLLGPAGTSAAEIVRLRLPDTGVAEHEAKAADTLVALVAGFGICAAPWSGDVHGDHEAAGRAAALACASADVAHVQYPVWMWHWARPDDPRVPWDRAVRVDLTPERRRRKRDAVGCFETQLRPHAPGRDDRVILPPEEIEHFVRPYEVVFR